MKVFWIETIGEIPKIQSAELDCYFNGVGIDESGLKYYSDIESVKLEYIKILEDIKSRLQIRKRKIDRELKKSKKLTYVHDLTGMIYAPYIPITITSTVVNGFGKKTLNPRYTVPINITHTFPVTYNPVVISP